MDVARVLVSTSNKNFLHGISRIKVNEEFFVIESMDDVSGDTLFLESDHKIAEEFKFSPNQAWTTHLEEVASMVEGKDGNSSGSNNSDSLAHAIIRDEVAASNSFDSDVDIQLVNRDIGESELSVNNYFVFFDELLTTPFYGECKTTPKTSPLFIINKLTDGILLMRLPKRCGQAIHNCH